MSDLWFNLAANTGGAQMYLPNVPYQPPGTPVTPTVPLTPYYPPLVPATPTGTPAQQISCDSCLNGYPQSNLYPGNSCPPNTVVSSSGQNPCASTTGLLSAQVYDIVANYGGSALYSNTTGPSYSPGMRGQIIQVYPGNPTDYTINWEDGTTTTVQGESTTLYSITGFQIGDRVKKNQYNLFGRIMNKIGNSIQIRWDDNTMENTMASNQIFVGTGSPMGCTNPMASNFNPNATSDDGTCTIGGCTDPIANNVVLGATYDDGSCTYNGCTDATAINYNPLATGDDGSCISSIPGCTNDIALNYNSLANLDDGSCSYPSEGCTNPLAVNYSEFAVIDNGSCQIEGCMDSNKFGYNPDATVDDGSCEEVYEGCISTDADNYDHTANTDDGSCVWTGCTDPTAINQAVLADGVVGTLVPDNSLCQYPTTGGPTPPPFPVGPVPPSTADEECGDDEMKIAGNCMKKNLVYIAVGVALYFAYSKGMFSKIMKK
tara:strand:+ start:3577 stop:5040 length:1464 start_codon:yes stop_codon:yes gene_type:complete